MLGSNNNTKAAGSNPSTVAVVFIDVSKSTWGARADYARDFNTIASSLQAGTVLKVGEIVSDPLADAAGLKSEYFERRGESLRSQNALTEQKQHDDAAADAEKYATALLKRRVEGNSILDSLNVAQRIFDSYPDTNARYLVIFSDMIETSKRYRFRPDTLKPASEAALIRQDRKSSLLPNLRGVQVYAIGAGITKGADTGLAHQIESFWLRYLAATHATIAPAHYTGQLIRFP